MRTRFLQPFGLQKNGPAVGSTTQAASWGHANDIDGIEALCSELTALASTLVVLEATGGYEFEAACALQAAGLAVAVVIVYAKPPFGGPERVLEYLGRYTHRVAISNNRLVEFTGEGACAGPQRLGLRFATLETLLQFCREIARGASSDAAANVVGVSSAVGARWFRQGGGCLLSSSFPCPADTFPSENASRSRCSAPKGWECARSLDASTVIRQRSPVSCGAMLRREAAMLTTGPARRRAALAPHAAPAALDAAREAGSSTGRSA